MRSFFIDLENVRSYGLEGILLLKPEDKVYVFYSDNANTLTIPTIESLNESSAQVKYIKTNYIGANAMDFQIVTLLGASIEKERSGRFYIISHDNGFKSAVKFCEGYFTGYDIVTGVFANILLAINSEKNKTLKNENHERKKQDKGETVQQTTADQPVPGAEQPATEQDNKNPTRSRNHRTRKNKNRKDVTTVINTESSVKDAVPADTANPPASEDKKAVSNTKKTANKPQKTENKPQKTVSESEGLKKDNKSFAVEKSEEGKESSKERGRNRRKKNKSQDNQDAKNVNSNPVPVKTEEAKQTGNNKKKEKPVDKSGNYKYVYNALSDFLSRNTIDMYAAKIDEGIMKSSNRNELHEFFKKNYGADEAEALYKIICSDFEKMKKEAGK